MKFLNFRDVIFKILFSLKHKYSTQKIHILSQHDLTYAESENIKASCHVPRVFQILTRQIHADPFRTIGGSLEAMGLVLMQQYCNKCPNTQVTTEL